MGYPQGPGSASPSLPRFLQGLLQFVNRERGVLAIPKGISWGDASRGTVALCHIQAQRVLSLSCFAGKHTAVCSPGTTLI